MIWTKALQAAALAIAQETGKPWYADHIEGALKSYAKTLATYPPGELSPIERVAVGELRGWLDPYRARPSHAAFKKAWAEAALQPA